MKPLLIAILLIVDMPDAAACTNKVSVGESREIMHKDSQELA